MKIICLSCGYKIDLGDAYDDYAGPVKCATCGAVLEIRTEAGSLKGISVTRPRAAEAATTPVLAHDPVPR